MTPQQHKELDRWLAVNVLGWEDDIKGSGKFYDGGKVIDGHNWQPTQEFTAAMVILDRCIQNYMGDVAISYWPQFKTKPYSVNGVGGDTLPIAVCKFAKVLFS